MSSISALCGLSAHLLAGLQAYARNILESAGYLPTPDRIADLAFGLSMAHLHEGEPAEWQHQSMEFPSGLHATPYTLFGLYDLETDQLKSLLADLPA